ncbi:MAG: MmcQ/YjbR family DNA-binding protein [Caulobacter sp.]|nr:MmcQ/YjbR family DNA-binding protein [Caulobacter sp.]
MTADEACSLAMALPGADETPHFESASFRVMNRIFATLSHDRQSLVLKLTPLVQEGLQQSHPGAVVPEAGRWGRAGWTLMVLERMEEETLSDLIRLAWTQLAPKALQGRT